MPAALLLLLPLALAAPPAVAPVGWAATSAEWRVTIRAGQPVALQATYTLATPDPRPGELALVGPELLITKVEGHVSSGEQGLTMSLGRDRVAAVESFAGTYVGPADS